MGEETSRYDAVAVALHWLIGVALLAQITSTRSRRAARRRARR
jgi:cytochrome b561